LSEKAGWSQGAILLYDLANAHVVLSNSFVESWKDGFLSSERGGAQAKMEQLADGMEALPLALADPADGVDLTDDIHYGCVVRSVERRRTSTAGSRVRVTYDSAAGGERTVDGDYVVFAVPFTVANLLRIKPSFGSAKRTAIRTLRYVEVTKVLVQFKTRWWERYLVDLRMGQDGGVITDLPIRYLMFPSAGSAQFQHGQQRGVVMASYAFGQDATELGSLTEADRLRIVARDLRTIFGKRVIDDCFEVGASQVWPATDTSGGSAFAYFGPGQRLDLFRGIVEPEWNGIAHFAGEHASYSHGWIEGAIESALRVADQIYQLQTT
jgi:monoamine oxidase